MGGRARHAFAAYTVNLAGDVTVYTFTPTSVAAAISALGGKVSDGLGRYDSLTFGVTGIDNKTFSVDIDLVGDGNWLNLESGVRNDTVFTVGPAGCGMHDTSAPDHRHEPWPSMMPHSVRITLSEGDGNGKISVQAWG